MMDMMAVWWMWGDFCYIESPYEMGRIAERRRVSQAHDRQFGTV